MLLQNYKTCSLSHYNYLRICGSNNDIFLATNVSGNLTIFNQNGAILKEINLEAKISSIVFFHQNEMIAFISNKNLFVVDYQLKTLFSSNDEYLEIKFQNDLLWTVKKISSKLVAIEIYNIETWNIIAQTTIIDIYSESAYSFENGCDKNSMVLWMAAGQDGQSNFFLNLVHGAIICTKFDDINTIPFIFNQNGTEYLVNHEAEKLLIYSFPENKLLKKFQYPEEIMPIDDVAYVNENKILLYNRHGLLYLANIASLSLEEVIIKGHEPKPYYYYYPTIRDEDLVTDISFIQRIGNYIFAPFSAKKKSSIIMIELSEFEHKENPNQLKFDF